MSQSGNGGFIGRDLYLHDRIRAELGRAAAGSGTSNGLGMLLHQGAAAFALWTGLEADLDIMKRALELAQG